MQEKIDDPQEEIDRLTDEVGRRKTKIEEPQTCREQTSAYEVQDLGRQQGAHAIRASEPANEALGPQRASPVAQDPYRSHMETDDDFHQLTYGYDTTGQSLNDRLPSAELQSRGSAPSRGVRTPSDGLFGGGRGKVPIGLSQMAGSARGQTQQTTIGGTSISQGGISPRTECYQVNCESP